VHELVYEAIRLVWYCLNCVFLAVFSNANVEVAGKRAPLAIRFNMVSRDRLLVVAGNPSI